MGSEQSWGPLKGHRIESLERLGFGQFGDMVRIYDPLWGFSHSIHGRFDEIAQECLGQIQANGEVKISDFQAKVAMRQTCFKFAE